MSIQETDHISLLRDSTMSNALNFSFYSLYCNLKVKDHIRRIINSKKKKYLYEYYCFDLPKIWVGHARTTKNSVTFALVRKIIRIYPYLH